MDENLMKMGAIALCLIICLPIGLGYALSFEDVERDVINSGRGTSISDSLLNDNYGTVEYYNNPINNQFTYPNNQIKRPNYNVYGSTITPYPEEIDIKMEIYDTTSQTPHKAPTLTTVGYPISTGSDVLDYYYVDSQGNRLVHVEELEYWDGWIEIVVDNSAFNFFKSGRTYYGLYDFVKFRERNDPYTFAIGKDSFGRLISSGYSEYKQFEVIWTSFDIIQDRVANKNGVFSYNPFNNSWDLLYTQFRDSQFTPFHFYVKSYSWVESDFLSVFHMSMIEPSGYLNKVSTPTNEYTSLGFLERSFSSIFFEIPEESSDMFSKIVRGQQSFLLQEGKILFGNESGELINIQSASARKIDEVMYFGTNSGMYADYIYGWTMPTNTGFFLKNLHQNKQYTIFASMDTNPASAINTPTGKYIGGAFDFLPMYSSDISANPYDNGEYSERIYIGWKKDLNNDWTDRYIEIWDERTHTKIWEKHISEIGNYTNVRVIIDCNFWQIDFFNGFAQIGATNPVQTFYVPRETPLNFITHIDVRQDVSFPKTTFRVDSTQIVNGKIPVSRNVVYDHVEKFGDTSYMVKIHSVAVYGDYIEFGGETFRLNPDGVSITVNGIVTRIRDLNLMSYKPPSSDDNPNPKFQNSLNGELVSETDTQSTIKLGGIWLVTAQDFSLSTSKETTKQFIAGGFGLDTQSFSLMAMVVAVAVFIGLGFWGVRSGAKIGLLLLICGGAILFFMTMV